MRKTPVAKDVDVEFLATLTEGFSGADLTELCQRATKAGIRELIEFEEKKKAAEALNPDMVGQSVDPVPELQRKHFEEALQCAKKTSNPQLMQRYEEFRRKYDPEYQNNEGGVQFSWPEDNEQMVWEQAQQNNNAGDDDDDLYG